MRNVSLGLFLSLVTVAGCLGPPIPIGDNGTHDMAAAASDLARAPDLATPPDLAKGNCGNAPCTFQNASGMCVNNVCVLGTCNPGFGDCDRQQANGCENSLVGDRNNCGSCGNVCAVNSPGCMGGACQPPVNNNCGFVPCTYPHGRGVCVNNMCFLGGCDNGWGDCNQLPADGCEVDLVNDPKNCGACNQVCLNGKACVFGACM